MFPAKWHGKRRPLRVLCLRSCGLSSPSSPSCRGPASSYTRLNDWKRKRQTCERVLGPRQVLKPAVYSGGLEPPGALPTGLHRRSAQGAHVTDWTKRSFGKPALKPTARAECPRLRATGPPFLGAQGACVLAPLPRTRRRAGPDLGRLGRLALSRPGDLRKASLGPIISNTGASGRILRDLGHSLDRSVNDIKYPREEVFHQ